MTVVHDRVFTEMADTVVQMTSSDKFDHKQLVDFLRTRFANFGVVSHIHINPEMLITLEQIEQALDRDD